MSLFGRLPRRGGLHSLAAPYALDALEGAERVRFERHLEGCDRCAADVRALSEDAVRLAWSTAAPAPDALRDRVLAAVRTTAQEPAPGRGPARRLPPHVWGGRPAPERSRPFRPRALPVPFATVTAAAALVIASLFAVQAHRTQGELDTARDRAREIAHVLAAPDTRATSGRTAGAEYRSGRFRIRGARGRHPERIRRAARRPRAPALARAPRRRNALPGPL